MENIVNILVNNGVAVGTLIYFMYVNYQFLNTINNSLTSINETLETIKQFINKERKDEK